MAAQLHLFPIPDAPKADKLEVHEHCFIHGPRANGWAYKFEHSHEGGEVPHTHPDTGPSSYTIDKDEWFARTGLRGGGRKNFTKAPTGEQFAVSVPRTVEEQTIEVIVCDPPKGAQFENVEGGGHHAAARMVMAFGMIARVIDGRCALEPFARSDRPQPLSDNTGEVR